MSAEDPTPALGRRGEPGSWRRADPAAPIPLAAPGFTDAAWSFLYKRRDTGYAAAEPAPGQVAEAALRMREATPEAVHGPFIKPPVWTWEVPLYFWVGGIASGSGFVALACDLAGDRGSAELARKVALGAVLPAPALLIADLGRPERFLNMLRIFKPRSPMNMGAWCLVLFSSTAAAGVGADLLHREREARTLGAVTALLGGYLGSYTGVLLACTAVPLWAASRSFLGPLFVATATATGAASCRLALVARGLPYRHPTLRALRAVESLAMLAELTLSAVNERRLGTLSALLRRGRPGALFRGAEVTVALGLGAQVLSRRRSGGLQTLASLLYLTGGLGFRYAWVEAGKVSARDDAVVAAATRTSHRGARDGDSLTRRPLPLPARRLWGETVRRTSLQVERLLRRR